MFDPAPYLALSATVNRFVEFIKPSLKNIPEQWYDAVLKGVSVMLGILLVLLAQGLNLFTGIPAINPVIGQVLTGVVVGLGAEVIDAVVDLIYSWQNPGAPSVTTTTSGGAATITASVSEPSTPTNYMGVPANLPK